MIRKYSDRFIGSGVNWTLFIVLLTFSLLHRLILFFSIPGMNCIGFSEYWFNEMGSGLSVFEGLIIVYLLCCIWAVVGLIDVYIHYKPSKRKTTAVIIQSLIVIFSMSYFMVTYYAYKISPDVIYHLEQKKIESQNDPFLMKKINKAKVYCTVPAHH